MLASVTPCLDRKYIQAIDYWLIFQRILPKRWNGTMVKYLEQGLVHIVLKYSCSPRFQGHADGQSGLNQHCERKCMGQIFWT